MYLLM
jgi:hypothetical protein